MKIIGRPAVLSLTHPGPLRLFNTGELLRLPPPTWLIDRILPVGGLVGVYGQPGVGKSFLAIDMALAVASGHPWQRHVVHPGFVLYVSAEGGTGIGKRVQAWLSNFGYTAAQPNIAWLTQSVAISSTSEDMNVLFTRLSDELEERPVLVAIDTLARCFDGDENQQEDMNRFIAGVDRLRREFGTTVIVVHHTRVDAERERGSTAFRGAAETMIRVNRASTTAPLAIVCNKQKDADEFPQMSLHLRTLPVTVAGVRTSSCVLVSDPSQKGSSPLQVAILGHLRQSPSRLGALYVYGAKSSIQRAVRQLVLSHQIINDLGYYTVSDS